MSVRRLTHLDDENAILGKGIVEGSKVPLIVVKSVTELNVVMRITA
jgi:hypothetical protein